MELFIPDLFEVLKCRVKRLTSPKESDDPAEVLVRLADVKSICSEIEVKANQQAMEIEKLRAEADAKKGV